MRNDELEFAIERYHAAGREFVQGNPEPQKNVFSHSDDVCLVNPIGVVAKGWTETAATMEQASAHFSEGKMEFERIAHGMTPKLAYITEIERWQAVVAGSDVSSGELRVTSVLRPEDGSWKVVLRHADPIERRSSPLRTD